jgi:hypothetical protein
MKEIKDYILSIGGEVNELQFGRIFIKWNGKDVRNKRYTCIVRVAGKGFIGNCFDSIIPSLLKYDIINPIELGYKKCLKCTGKGIVEHYRYNDKGICFKCEGAGIIK